MDEPAEYISEAIGRYLESQDNPEEEGVGFTTEELAERLGIDLGGEI